MPAPVVGEMRHTARHVKKPFNVVFLATIFLGLHWSTVLYFTSTYLEQFVPSTVIGALYIIGSALTVFAFLFISRVLRKLGNYQLTIGLAILEVFALVGLAFAPSLAVAVPLFVLHQAIVPLILFNIDVFAEHIIGDNEATTGGKRGLLLTLMSLAGAVAPLVAGFVIGDGEPRYTWAYLLSAGLMLPFLYIIGTHFKTFKDPRYSEVEVLSTIHQFWINKDLRFVFLAHFLLQLFFAWTVIYIPLYLATVIGLPWSEIGIILFAGLFAYVIFEYPIGLLADNRYGEKEMMAIGFIILAVTTAWISFLATPALIPWIITMFLTRVGASFIEVTTESYFFKHTKGSDANVISFFRITRPLAIVGGALLGSFLLLYMPFSNIFLFLGLLLLIGVAFAMFLVDTR